MVATLLLGAAMFYIEMKVYFDYFFFGNINNIPQKADRNNYLFMIVLFQLVFF